MQFLQAVDSGPRQDSTMLLSSQYIDGNYHSTGSENYRNLPSEPDLKTVVLSISLEEMTSLSESFISVLFDEVSFRPQKNLFRTAL